MNWAFTAGAPLDLGFVEAVDSDAAKWLPAFGDDRFIVAKLKDPSQVEAVRFSIASVSQHPGIATNANIGAVDANARKLTPAPVQVAAGQVRWTRFYQTYAATDGDTRPDLEFDQEKNPGFSFDGAGVSVLRTDKVSKEVTAVVTARDWAASGLIRAQIKVDGIWEDLPSRGSTVAADKISLQLPLDANGNGIADAWEADNAADDDRDGIAAFDEYRGAYVNGEHVRLKPDEHDAFVLDYTTRSRRHVDELKKGMAAEAVTLHLINGAEHRSELIGNSRLIVVEELRENALPALLPSPEPAQAWTALKPGPEFRTLFLNGPSNQQLLARDLRQILELSPKTEVAESP